VNKYLGAKGSVVSLSADDENSSFELAASLVVKFLQLLTADSHPVWRFPFDAKTFSRLYLGSTLFFWGCLVMDRRKLVLLACSLIAKFHEYLESLTLLLQRRRARRRKLMLLLNILVRRFLLERGCISAAR
jgi:hypothetical protein